MASPLSIEINGIDPVTIAAVELIIQTLPELRLRLVDSRRLSAELIGLLPEERLLPRRSQALRSHLAKHYPHLRYCSSYSPIDLGIIASVGSHDLEKADAMMHCDIPHLLTCRNEGYWDIGPLVVPGVTCCARCLETTQSERHSLPSLGRDLELWRFETPLPWLTHMAAAWLSLMIYDFARFGMDRRSSMNRFLRITTEGEVSWIEVDNDPLCGCTSAAVSQPPAASLTATTLSTSIGKFDMLSHNHRYRIAS